MKVGVRVDGAGFSHAENLTADLRRRVTERLRGRREERRRTMRVEELRVRDAAAGSDTRSVAPERS